MLEIENRRKALQDNLDAQKKQRERNIMGQFSTPYLLALDIMQHMKSLIKGNNVSLFEPSIGTGVFYSVFAEVFGTDKKAFGIELDNHYFSPAKQLWEGFPLEIVQADFFNITPDRQFPLLVANPPYIRHHHIENSQKQELQLRTYEQTGIKTSGLTGMYCYFLMLSEQWLEDGGISCWLIPSEFMDVNYGKALKHYLLNNVELLQIHRFNATDLQFADALVSSCIVIFRKAKPQSNSPIRFTLGGSISKPEKEILIDRQEIADSQKWTNLFENGIVQTNETEKLGDYFIVKRGVVTGDNNFFIVDDNKIEQYGIDKKFLYPILPSPRYIKGDVIEATGELPDIERQEYLFSCNLSESILKQQYPGTWSYIQEGERQGVRDGYICSRRTPWYSCEERPPASIIVPYMGRSDTNKRMFRFILNKSKAITTNVYLLLYPKPQYARSLRDLTILTQVWHALNSIPQERMIKGGRFYGGGLRKMEPNELMNIPLSEISGLLEEDNKQLSLFQ